ncbi:MAG TPA: nitroreductase family protein [Chloroflexota bacterium]|nr:nitroreductase family protein [Chloroflexota bacterium]
MTLAALIQGRRSIRTYRDIPIPAADLESIVDAGRWAPSPHHSLPFRFAVLSGASAREALCQAMADQWRLDLGADHVPEPTIEVEVAKSQRRLLGAAAIIIGCVYLHPLDTYPDPARQQAEHTMAAHALGAALQNMMLTAHAQGVGSAWMCAPLFCPDTVRAALELPEAWIPHALLTLGYALRETPPGVRPPLDQIIRRYP